MLRYNGFWCKALLSNRLPVLGVMLLVACAPPPPLGLGAHEGQLSPCPSSPNCVSSEAAAGAQHIPALRLVTEPASAWRALTEQLEALPRTVIITRTADYLHAETHSALFGFVDDIEFYLPPDAQRIAVRSASRSGYWDLGVNRRRLTELTARLQALGVVR